MLLRRPSRGNSRQRAKSVMAMVMENSLYRRRHPSAAARWIVAAEAVPARVSCHFMQALREQLQPRMPQATLGSLKASGSSLKSLVGTQLQNTFLSPNTLSTRATGGQY